MYCTACGNKVTEGLQYCNFCGNRVALPAETGGSRIDPISKAIGLIAVSGLIGFIILASLVIKSDLPPDLKAIIPISYLITLFGICFLLIRQMSKTASAPEKPERIVRVRDTRELEMPARKGLHETREAPASVVEETTRTLGKALADRE